MRPLLCTIAIASTAFVLAACDDGTRDETALARSRDSALASDLRLARGDTAAPAGGIAGDQTGDVPPMLEPRGTLASNSGSAGVIPDDRTTTTLSSGAVDLATPAASSSASAEGYLGPACASPALPDQRRCLSAYLARSDVTLDRHYQSLIAALKREAGKQAGDREPPTVVRLRTAQRNWLVYRDDECRRRSAGTEGPLWAPTRAKCLAEYSALRTQELENALSSRASAKPVVKAAVAKSAPAKHAKAKRARHRRR